MTTDLKIRSPKWYGWRPDTPDHRDHTFSIPHVARIPQAVDLRPFCPPIYDQGELGSCTANAIAFALEYDRLRQTMPDVRLSRLFIYWKEREIEGTISEDAGAEIRDGIKVVNKIGAPPEARWPYIIQDFDMRPHDGLNPDTYAITYARVTPVEGDLLRILASHFPVVFGFSVYENFESGAVAQNGVVHMPSGRLVGGHAVALVGYDRPRRNFLVRNSWGTDWGQKGYFWMPFDYVCNSNLADDFWVIKQVKE